MESGYLLSTLPSYQEDIKTASGNGRCYEPPNRQKRKPAGTRLVPAGFLLFPYYERK